jgi:5,6,7,8-tetrahydromethanopterin hydro-lyase
VGGAVHLRLENGSWPWYRDPAHAATFFRKPIALAHPPAINALAQMPKNQTQQRSHAMSMYIGEALAGDGNEIAHIDLLIGDKAGPVGIAFATALANQKAGHSNLLAVLTPNLICKPATVLITKVTIKGAKQAVQMFGPAQAAVAKAVADSVAEGVIPKADAENLCIICGVFIHWQAEDNKKIYDYNYTATKMAIANAMKGEPKIDEITAKKDTAKHPFA